MKSWNEKKEKLEQSARADGLGIEKRNFGDAGRKRREDVAKRSFGDANEAVRAGDFVKASRDVEFAIERSPANPDYLTLRADLLQSSGQFKKATDAYREAVEKGAGERAKMNLAWCAAQEEPELASPETYAHLAALLDDQGRHSERPLLDAAWKASAQRSRQDPSTGEVSMAVPKELRSLAGWSDERFKISGERVELNLSGLPIDSLAGLNNLPLRSLDLRGTKASDLSPLTGRQLEVLSVAEGTGDISPLRVDGLRVLDLSGSKVADLGPLAGAAKLEELWLDKTPVQNLEPLRGLPLKRLHVDVPEVKIFDVIGSLASLEELILPVHAAGVPVAGLPLKKVRHPRFQEAGEMSGVTFKEFSAKTDEAWRKWRGELFKLGVRDPERVTVVPEDLGTPDPFPDSFDLDLRGLTVTDVRPLQEMRINRLYLDTKTEVDLRPLEDNDTLRHLVLTGANVPTLQGVVDNKELKSIVLSAETDDVHRLKTRTNIIWAGYSLDKSKRLPTTTSKQLFEERDVRSVLREHPKSRRYTDVAFLFDDPGMDAQSESNKKKWQVEPQPKNGSRRPVWRPDPTAEGGKGGGYIQFFEREEDGQTSHFVLPGEFANQRRKLYGSSVGFELRAEGDGERSEGEEFIIRSRDQDLYYSFSGRHPAEDWRKFRVTLKEGDGWTVGSPTGPPATAEDMQSALMSAREFWVRAEFFKDGSYERTSLDNVVFWDPVETNQRVDEEMAEERAKDKWIAVESRRLEDWMKRVGLKGESADADRERVRILEYRGRRLPLLVGAASIEQPARVTIRPERPTEAKTLVRFAARGAPGSPGVRVKIRQGEEELREVAVGNNWTEVFATLPQGGAGKGETLCVIEVWPNGDLDPYCFISDLELVPPSGRK